MGSSLVRDVLGLLVLALVIVRQLRPRVLNPTRMLIPPLLFVVIGVSSDKRLGHELSGRAGLSLFGAGLVVALVMGVLRGRSIRLSRQGAEVTATGTPLTAILWATTLAIRLALAAVAATLAAPEGIGEVFLFVAATLAVQSAYVLMRAGSVPAGGPA